MHWTQTQRYVEHVASLDADRVALQKELAQLAGTKLAAARKAQIRGRLRTVINRAERAHSLKGFTWPDLIDMLSEAMGWAWTAEELELLKQERASFEGRGEKSLRHRLGLPLQVSLASADLPNDEEVKYLGPHVEPVRVGKTGKRAYISVLRKLADELITPEMWDGEVSAGKLYGGGQTACFVLQVDLTPECVLSCYAAIYLTTEQGYLRIPREDYARAFSLACVTQYSPKYRLRREYVVSKLLTTQQQPEVAA